MSTNKLTFYTYLHLYVNFQPLRFQVCCMFMHIFLSYKRYTFIHVRLHTHIHTVEFVFTDNVNQRY